MRVIMVVEVYQRRLRPKMSIFNWIVIELPDPTRCRVVMRVFMVVEVCQRRLPPKMFNQIVIELVA